jgi:hypothetical protein
MIEKPWKAPPATILLTQFPQLWRPVWRCEKSLQIMVIGRCGHDAFSALRGARHAAMLAARRRRGRTDWRA